MTAWLRGTAATRVRACNWSDLKARSAVHPKAGVYA
jgi:hypothetical protein